MNRGKALYLCLSPLVCQTKGPHQIFTEVPASFKTYSLNGFLVVSRGPGKVKHPKLNLPEGQQKCFHWKLTIKQ